MRVFLFALSLQLCLPSLALGAPISWSQRWKKASGSYKGCFALYDLDARKYLFISGKKACKIRYAPCSTFKVPHALLGLHTKAITATERFKWDGKRRFYKAWNRSHDLASALRYSVVWVFQKIATRIGAKKMQHWLAKLGYGNQKMSGKLQRFWLNGSLRISALEQIGFLQKLYQNRLPVDAKAQRKVRQLMVLKRKKGWVFSGKTGSNFARGKWTLGWFVGHLRSGKRQLLFATQIHRGKKPNGSRARRITLKMLKGL